MSADVFDRIEQLLPEEPTDRLPSRAQFIARDRVVALGVFEEQWDKLPPLLRGRQDYRELIRGGALVFSVVFIARLRTDGTVEVIDVDIEPHPAWDSEDLPDD